MTMRRKNSLVLKKSKIEEEKKLMNIYVLAIHTLVWGSNRFCGP